MDVAESEDKEADVMSIDDLLAGISDPAKKSDPLKLAADLRRIGTQQAGLLATESGELWHPANLLLPAADALDALASLAQWMTGCGYDFTQHEYFKKKQHLLAGSGATDETPEPFQCAGCGRTEETDGMWHSLNCPEK
jgi:hypothetical protein